MHNSLKYWKTIVVIIYFSTILFLIPFFINIRGNIFIEYLYENRDGFNNTLIRSLVFAFVSALLNVIFGFIGAITLKKISFFSFRGISLSILLVPFLLGNVSIAFLFKILLYQTSFFTTIINSHRIYHFILLICLQFWQFGLLFMYLFWLNFKNIPKEIEEYAYASKFGFFTKLKNIFLPYSRSLFILLFIISFVFSFYENAKSQFILKASQGINTELITNWLYRTYQSKLLVNPNYATNDTFSNSLFLIIFMLASLFIFITLFNFFIKKITTYQYNYSKQTTKSNSSLYRKAFLHKYVHSLLILIIFVPILIVFLKIKIHFSKELFNLGFPFFITLIAAFVATVIAILFGISSRIAWKNRLNNFNNFSIAFFVFLYLLLLIPPLCILISGFKWMAFLGYSSNFYIYLIWIIGHSILLLPLLGSFVLATHFKISNNEFSYFNSLMIKRIEITQYTFISRFKLEYLLTLIIAFSFIWNEAIINKVFSDRIPSFVSNLEMLFVGRGADYTSAFGYLIISFILVAMGITIWITIINKNKKIKLVNEKYNN